MNLGATALERERESQNPVRERHRHLASLFIFPGYFECMNLLPITNLRSISCEFLPGGDEGKMYGAVLKTYMYRGEGGMFFGTFSNGEG